MIADRLVNVCVPPKVFEFDWKQVPPIERQPFVRERPFANVEEAEVE